MKRYIKRNPPRNFAEQNNLAIHRDVYINYAHNTSYPNFHCICSLLQVENSNVWALLIVFPYLSCSYLYVYLYTPSLTSWKKHPLYRKWGWIENKIITNVALVLDLDSPLSYSHAIGNMNRLMNVWFHQTVGTLKVFLSWIYRNELWIVRFSSDGSYHPTG